MIKENFWDSVKGYIDTRLNALDGTELKASLKTMFDEYSVKPVYEIRSQILTVFGMKSNIETVITYKPDIDEVNDQKDSIKKVADDIVNVAKAGGDLSNIDTVSNNIADVNKVADSQDDVTVVSNDIKNENHLKTVSDMITTGVAQGSVVWEPNHNGIQFMDKSSGTTNLDGSPLTEVVIPADKNAFAIDNYTVDNGVTLIIEDGAVLKVI